MLWIHSEFRSRFYFISMQPLVVSAPSHAVGAAQDPREIPSLSQFIAAAGDTDGQDQGGFGK